MLALKNRKIVEKIKSSQGGSLKRILEMMKLGEPTPWSE